MSEPLTDSDPMPFGEYEGRPMEDVPGSYLAKLKEQGCDHPGVMTYIENCWAAIEQECDDRIF